METPARNSLAVHACCRYHGSMADDQEISCGSGKSSPLWIYLVTLVLFFLVYPLSVGPIAKFYKGKPPAALVKLYAPLDFLYRRSAIVEKLFTWYREEVWHVR
jgi:hypothetical protein